MKMSMEDLIEYFNNSPELKNLNQKDLPDEEFAEIIKNSFNDDIGDTLIEYIISHFGKRFNFKKMEEHFFRGIKFEISAENKSLLFNLLKYFIVIKTLNLPLKENDGIKLINQISTFKEFQEEVNIRINNLKDDLIKKHQPYNEYINLKFTEFCNSFNKELNEVKSGIIAINELEILGKNVINFQLPQQGRPNDLLFDTFLLKINEFGDALCPEDKYSKLIKPFFIFIARHYPKLIDLDDVNDTEKLRQRVIYLKSRLPSP